MRFLLQFMNKRAGNRRKMRKWKYVQNVGWILCKAHTNTLVHTHTMRIFSSIWLLFGDFIMSTKSEIKSREKIERKRVNVHVISYKLGLCKQHILFWKKEKENANSLLEWWPFIYLVVTSKTTTTKATRT